MSSSLVSVQCGMILLCLAVSTEYLLLGVTEQNQDRTNRQIIEYNYLHHTIPVAKVGWLNAATSAGFEPLASSDLFDPASSMLIAPLLTQWSLAFSLYVRALRHALW